MTPEFEQLTNLGAILGVCIALLVMWVCNQPYEEPEEVRKERWAKRFEEIDRKHNEKWDRIKARILPKD